MSKQIDLRKSDNNIYCTQYSDLWWELRRTALLTGSTITKALGFDTLKAEKQQVNMYVKKRPAPDFTDKVKKYIQFRKENEVHAISTLVGLILPALKTKCYSFYEVGPQFIQGQNRPKLIDVSADGIIECPLGPTCSNKRVPDQHKHIVVKAKCVYPSTDFPKFPLYSLPFCHVPHVLAEMKAYNAQQLWLVTYILQSTTLMELDFDPILSDKIMSLTEKKYGVPKPVIPTRLSEESKSLRPEMMNFIKTHSRLVCEVPSFRGKMEINLPEFYISPYATTSMFIENKPDYLHMFGMSCLIADDAELLLKKIHNVLRLQATELLVFMISDKDRLQDSSAPNSIPLAYALKGRCLSNSELRYLINKVRNMLHERKIKVLCEIYNGQWQYTVMHNKDGNPPNRLRVSTETWSRISKFSKSRIVDKLMFITNMKLGDIDLLRFSMCREGVNTYNNVDVTKTSQGALHITTLGGKINEEAMFKVCHQPT